MRQVAPEPTALISLVERVTYKPGWSIRLYDIDRGQGSEGLTLIIQVAGVDTNTLQPIRVNHYMIVPAAAYDERSWRRWLFEQIHLVELHEAAAFFRIDGVQPYAPSHGSGNDPYLIRELGTVLDREQTFRD